MSLALAAWALPVPVHAQGATPPAPATDDAINRVAKQLYCPVCENTPLDVCPTEACAQWRAVIGDKLAAGWTDQQIFDYFAAQYGERVLARPSARGLNLLVWLAPPALLLLRRLWPVALSAERRSRTSRAHRARPPPTDDYAQRIEQELAAALGARLTFVQGTHPA